MNRPLLCLILTATAAFAASAHAQSAVSVVGGSPKSRAIAYRDPLGPRLPGSATVAESVARAQIEEDGYSGVRNLVRTSGGGWQAVALSRANAPVVVSLDGRGKLTELR
jgi:hypothetical protein